MNEEVTVTAVCPSCGTTTTPAIPGERIECWWCRTVYVAPNERPPASPQRSYVTPEQVPAGYYALDTEPMKFYRLNYGIPGTQWAGSLFVTAIGGPEEYRIRNREARNEIIAAIAADPQGAMLRYGLNIGRCGHCNRRLTDEQSRLDGIGPICKAKMGW